jgi:hypothetical protein
MHEDGLTVRGRARDRGGALFVPSAPGRFSTTIGLPSRSATCSSTVRAMMSPALPGLIGEIARIGELGQPSAALQRGMASAATAALTRMMQSHRAGMARPPIRTIRSGST